MDTTLTNDLELYCEYLKMPLGLETDAPRFSWKGTGVLSATCQKTYRVEVWNADGAVWDSGVVVSSQSNAICYNGITLQSATRYSWRVTIATEDDQCFFNESWFEMGLLREGDWKGAQWIGHPNPERGVVAMLRRCFSLQQKPNSARLYLSGIGYANVAVNGRKIDNSVLDPGWTDYQKTVLYRAWDVTSLLHPGENVLSVELGEGWYGNDHPNFLNLVNAMPPWLGTPKMICLLQADGIQIRSGADGMWMTSDGPIRKNNIFDGEWYDGRREKIGWQRPGYKMVPGEWLPAVHCQEPGGILRCQTMPYIGKKRELQPVYVTYPDDGDAFEATADFGVNIAGWAGITVQGTAGQKVELRYAEMVGSDNSVRQGNLRGAKATDIFILGHDGENTYEPRFTYHGFRYVQIKTDPGVVVTKIRAWEIHTLIEQTGDFHCNNALLNQIYAAVLQTEQNNLHSVPTDCPQRDERLAWINDMTVRGEEALYNFDMMPFYEKWLQDLADSQDPETGAIPDTAPYFYGGRPAFHISSIYVLLPWHLYWFYGDKRPMERHYEGMKRYVTFKLLERDASGLLPDQYFGDWATPMTENLLGWGENALPMSNPRPLVTTCYLLYDCMIMAQIATLLGKQRDAEAYRALQQEVARDINSAYFHENGFYADNSQGANIFPLFLDIVPEGKHDAVLQSLLDDLFAVHQGKVTTGNQLTKYLYEVLRKESCNQQAFTLATRCEYPSIGFMMQHGATTIWERWEQMSGNHMNSHNHPMMGAFSIWFQKGLCGLDPQCRTADGNLLLKPNIVDGLQMASARLGTPQGPVSLAWKKETHGLVLKVEVPWNSTVTVDVPVPAVSVDGQHLDRMLNRVCNLTPGIHEICCAE